MNYNPAKLFEIVLAFRAEKDYFDLLDNILAKLMELTNADAGTLYIIEDGKLFFRIVKNATLNLFQSSREEISLPPIVLDPENIANISAHAAIKNEIMLIDDVYGSTDKYAEGPRKYDAITGYKTCSMLTMPLTATVGETEKVIGVFQLLNPIDEQTGRVTSFGDIFNPPVLPSIANIAANTLANLLHEKEMTDLLHSFVRVMTQAIDERSPYNSNHTHNVALYCEKFVQYLAVKFTDRNHRFHFTKNRGEQLVMAAFLHDIGKIITPLYIMDKPDRLGEQLESLKYRFEIKKQQLEIERLSGRTTAEEYAESTVALKDALELVISSNTAGFLPDDKLERIKQLALIKYINIDGEIEPILTAGNIISLSVRKGTLTDEERGIMQEHVSVTDRLLENMQFSESYKSVPKWAKSHHEFLDGTGYPLGLSGEDVTTEMRILTIMDIYDALTANDRPYKRAMTPEKSLGILSEMVGEGKLSEELVALFIESEAWKRD